MKKGENIKSGKLRIASVKVVILIMVIQVVLLSLFTISDE